VAPYTEEFDWYAGMADDSALRASREGREARLAHGATAEFNEDAFLPIDWKTLESTWSSLGKDAGAASASAEAQADDDVAFTSPWGFARRIAPARPAERRAVAPAP
jgi:hypothetical protein